MSKTTDRLRNLVELAWSESPPADGLRPTGELADGRNRGASTAELVEIPSDLLEEGSATEDRLMEERLLHAVFRLFPFISFIVDRDGRLKAAGFNSERLELFKDGGIAPRKQGEAFKCADLDPDQGCGFGPVCMNCVMRNTAAEVLLTGEPVFNREGKLTLQVDGLPRRFDVLLNCVPFRVREKRHAILTVSDVTDVKELERERLALSERMARIGTSAAGIVHDLRNPLTGIMGFAQVLQRKLDDPKLARIVDRLYGSAQRLNDMVEEILSIARGDDLDEVKPSRQGLMSLVQEVVDEMNPEASVLVDTNCRTAVGLDREKFRDVLWNLIKNADQELSGRDDGRIEVSCRKNEEDLVLSISDNGSGVSPEVAAGLFEPGVTFGKAGGSGFGLYNVRRIVGAHGGEIWYEPSRHGGAAFHIKLPRS